MIRGEGVVVGNALCLGHPSDIACWLVGGCACLAALDDIHGKLIRLRALGRLRYHQGLRRLAQYNIRKDGKNWRNDIPEFRIAGKRRMALSGLGQLHREFARFRQRLEPFDRQQLF